MSGLIPKEAFSLTIDGALAVPVAAQGTLSMATNPTAGDTMTVGAKTYTFRGPLVTGVAAQGTLTMDTKPTDGDTMTVGAKTYTFKDNIGAGTDGLVQIGGSLAQTQWSLVKAFDLSGIAGVDYGTNMTAHPTVDIAAFASDDAVLTAKTAGTAGNAIATTETFTAGTNVFDAATLGTTTAGVDAVTVANTDGNVIIGGSAAATQASLVKAFDLSGTGGVDYAAAMTAHPTVDIAAFAANDAVLTAKTAGTAGNSIATTETFTAGGNVFDAATLGTTRAGVDGSTKSMAMPVAGTLIYMAGAVGTAPTVTSLLVDAFIEGTTVFTNQANRLAILAGATSGTTEAIAVTDFAVGDILRVDVEQIGSGVAGSDLTVTFAYKGDTTP